MKVKLDENLPARLVAAFASLGHDADTVGREGMKGRPDLRVWEAAQHAGRLLITQDLDFSDIRRFAPGTHHGILLLRLRAPGRKALFERIMYLFEQEGAAGWSRCFAVATDWKVRVRRPRA